ncbi:GspH/FimT family pseudopilin [Halothiobacillus sp.]|uniref:GspH/FimT family pseudopilin n=1 Tax=Halothiobacillus sp. TaxID=1891311 RepID=UPI002619BC2A|nr:GspH/FimT family pseudopilin [Halothiobacillus sp.]MDD4965937.1 GspH/FimT family pseudopilin [Halothiobacillus sp.]
MRLNPHHTTPASASTHPRGSQGRHRRMRGFTIIELMITLVVAAILLAIAIPSFTYLTVSNKLTTSANSLVSNLAIARMAAIKRNADVGVCGDNTCSVNFPAGSATVIHAGISGIQPSVIDIKNVKALNYGAQGLAHTTTSTAPYSGLVADIYTGQISSNNHRCVYLTSGSVVSTCTESNANCTAGGPSGTCQ